MGAYETMDGVVLAAEKYLLYQQNEEHAE